MVHVVLIQPLFRLSIVVVGEVCCVLIPLSWVVAGAAALARSFVRLVQRVVDAVPEVTLRAFRGIMRWQHRRVCKLLIPLENSYLRKTRIL